MQFLATALPGLRQLRAPVVAGYLWLAFAWLVVQPDLTKRPSSPLAASIWNLGHDVGRVGVFLGVSIVAYFLGAVSQTLSGLLRAAWTGLLHELWYFLPLGVDDVVGLPARIGPPEGDEIVQIAERASAAVAAASPSDHDDDDPGSVRAVASRAMSEASAELELPATVLVGREPQLFAEVDRLRGEAEFRLAAVPPLTALTTLATASISFWFVLAIVPLVVLLDQGVRNFENSRKLVADAKARGLVPSQALERFRSWAEAVEAKPEAPPPPPWSPRNLRAQRHLTSEQRTRLSQLSTMPDGEQASALQRLQEMSPDAREALRVFGQDELSNAGSATPVGFALTSTDGSGRRYSGGDELRALGLIEPADPQRTADTDFWHLADEGIALARLLTASSSSRPELAAAIEALSGG